MRPAAAQVREPLCKGGNICRKPVVGRKLSAARA